jgi:hypothetical protein
MIVNDTPNPACNDHASNQTIASKSQLPPEQTDQRLRLLFFV